MRFQASMSAPPYIPLIPSSSTQWHHHHHHLHPPPPQYHHHSHQRVFFGPELNWRRWSDVKDMINIEKISKSQQNGQKQFQICFPLVCGDLECYVMVCPKVRAQAKITVINSVCVEFKMRSQSVARLVHSLLQTNILSCLTEHNLIVKLPPMSSLLQSYPALNSWQTFQL